jgi:hypothetical protein
LKDSASVRVPASYFNGATGIEGIEIDTTYVRPTLLEAFIPAQALRFGGFYSVRVRNVSLLPEVSGEAVTFQVNNLGRPITSLDPAGPLAIIGPGPVPVTFDMKINGSNFFPQTVVAVTQKIPDIFPAIVPVGGISQCVPVKGRTVLRVRVYNSVGQPAGGVAVTFTAPTIRDDRPERSIPWRCAQCDGDQRRFWLCSTFDRQLFDSLNSQPIQRTLCYSD